MKSTGTWSSTELQWLDLKIGHQDGTSSLCPIGKSIYCELVIIWSKMVYKATVYGMIDVICNEPDMFIN